jgi:hypothetical protein
MDKLGYVMCGLQLLMHEHVVALHTAAASAGQDRTASTLAESSTVLVRLDVQCLLQQLFQV